MVGLKKARLNKGNTNTLFDAYSEEEYEYDLAGNPYRYRVGSSAWNAVSSNKNNQTTQIDYASDAVLPVRGKASASATLNVSVDGVQQAYTRPNQEKFAIGLNAFSATKKYQEVRVEAVDTDNGNTIRTMQRGKAYIEATPESFTYDANGNLLSDGRWNYTWDAENRLVEVETNLSAASAGVPQEKHVYVYDWTGRKVKSERYEYKDNAWMLVSTNKRYYDDYNLIYETTEYADGSSTEVRKYYYGTDLLGSVYGSAGTGGLRMMSINAEDLFVFNNQVGSVEALFGAETNTAAQARAEYVYSAYGEVMMKSGDLADKNNITYSTRYKEANTGLVSYTYRHYSPRLKKWLSKDPIAEQGGLNLYQMVGNAPVGYWDFLGYFFMKNPFAGPSVFEQINPWGLRGVEGEVDYTEWFEKNLRNIIDKHLYEIEQEINEKIKKLCFRKGNIIESISRVVPPEGQSFYTAQVELGSFTLKSKPADINWKDPIAPKCEKKWSWGTDVELFDTTGIGGNTNPGSAEALMQTLHLGWLFKPRKMKYGEFHITGSGECK